MFSHNSTHIDAPFHILPDSPKLDELPLEAYYGPGVVVDCRHSGAIIKKEDFLPYVERLKKADFILLYTGWYKKWTSIEYKNDFPVMTVEAAEWLMQFKLKGIGLDTISIDEIQSTGLPVHKIVLGRNLIIIENLTNLEELLDKDFIFNCFPLPIEAADGSPVRAVGIIEG
ncbi:MAG: cyclase family protein [Bacteroidales bacterium]|nr:cyclase family protein [Bacteroidales bacterium]